MAGEPGLDDKELDDLLEDTLGEFSEEIASRPGRQPDISDSPFDKAVCTCGPMCKRDQRICKEDFGVERFFINTFACVADPQVLVLRSLRTHAFLTHRQRSRGCRRGCRNRRGSSRRIGA